jgi:hypothetical protein
MSTSEPTVSVFMPYTTGADTSLLQTAFNNCSHVKEIFLFSSENNDNPQVLKTESLYSSETMELITKKASSDYILFITCSGISISRFFTERFISVAEAAHAGLLYSDYYEIKGNERLQYPVIEYQQGSIRDDFNFGKIVLLKKKAAEEAIKESSGNYKYAGFYDLRLAIARSYNIIRIPEYLYSVNVQTGNEKGERHFDYVNPKNRDVQIEMETTVTCHLKKTGAYLKPEFKEEDIFAGNFEYEASVIIPVRNRVKTIGDAIKSVLAQKTNFKFNLIITDNYSSDGTTEIIKKYAAEDNRVVHIIPDSTDLGIGGCWNEAVHHEKCGRFAVQLDSDDVYPDENTLQRVVDVFRKEKCVMVIGSYKLTDFNLNDIPPGIIDHKEWTPDNGRNNALRINGLGAPRAYYTPLLRKIKIPNVSYGEDYAAVLAISRNYRIGRIYEPVYICRRWEGNSDSALPVIKQNENNFYKDKIRTIEILARQKKNKEERDK